VSNSHYSGRCAGDKTDDDFRDDHATLYTPLQVHCGVAAYYDNPTHAHFVSSAVAKSARSWGDTVEDLRTKQAETNGGQACGRQGQEDARRLGKVTMSLALAVALPEPGYGAAPDDDDPMR
jgi:hypothetical protein